MAQKHRQAAGLSKSPKTAYPEEMALRIINDYIFKYVFGREETKDVLMDIAGPRFCLRPAAPGSLREHPGLHHLP